MQVNLIPRHGGTGAAVVIILFNAVVVYILTYLGLLT